MTEHTGAEYGLAQSTQGYAQQEPAGPSPHATAHNRLRESIDRLEKNVELLGSRLEVVLSPSEPILTGVDDEKAMVPRRPSELVGRVQADADRLSFLADRVMAITKRIEL